MQSGDGMDSANARSEVGVDIEGGSPVPLRRELQALLGLVRVSKYSPNRQELR